MADANFFSNQGPFSLADIARLTGAELRHGSADAQVKDVAPLDTAGPEHLSFLDNTKYLKAFIQSKAGACFVHPRQAEKAPKGMALLISNDPYRAYALAAQKFYPSVIPKAFISPQAHISSSAQIGKNVTIEAGAFIGERATIGTSSIIRANAVIGDGVTIGEHTVIGACSTVTHAHIGSRVIIHRGVHIGQDGFGFAMGREGHVKVPQLGRVIIEDEVEIGSGTTVDRGAGPDTIIGQGTKIDNLVQIGHNVVVGKNAVIVALVGISGSTHIGDGVVIGGQAGFVGHIKIGAGARIAARSGVMNDIPPGETYGGAPAQPMKEWLRETAMIRKLARKEAEKHD